MLSGDDVDRASNWEVWVWLPSKQLYQGNHSHARDGDFFYLQNVFGPNLKLTLAEHLFGTRIYLVAN